MINTKILACCIFAIGINSRYSHAKYSSFDYHEEKRALVGHYFSEWIRYGNGFGCNVSRIQVSEAFTRELPSWLIFNVRSGQIHGVPQESDIGTLDLLITGIGIKNGYQEYICKQFVWTIAVELEPETLNLGLSYHLENGTSYRTSGDFSSCLSDPSVYIATLQIALTQIKSAKLLAALAKSMRKILDLPNGLIQIIDSKSSILFFKQLPKLRILSYKTVTEIVSKDKLYSVSWLLGCGRNNFGSFNAHDIQRRSISSIAGLELRSWHVTSGEMDGPALVRKRRGVFFGSITALEGTPAETSVLPSRILSSAIFTSFASAGTSSKTILSTRIAVTNLSFTSTSFAFNSSMPETTRASATGVLTTVSSSTYLPSTTLPLTVTPVFSKELSTRSASLTKASTNIDSLASSIAYLTNTQASMYSTTSKTASIPTSLWKASSNPMLSTESYLFSGSMMSTKSSISPNHTICTAESCLRLSISPTAYKPDSSIISEVREESSFYKISATDRISGSTFTSVNSSTSINYSSSTILAPTTSLVSLPATSLSKFATSSTGSSIPNPVSIASSRAIDISASVPIKSTGSNMSSSFSKAFSRAINISTSLASFRTIISQPSSTVVSFSESTGKEITTVPTYTIDDSITRMLHESSRSLLYSVSSPTKSSLASIFLATELPTSGALPSLRLSRSLIINTTASSTYASSFFASSYSGLASSVSSVSLTSNPTRRLTTVKSFLYPTATFSTSFFSSKQSLASSLHTSILTSPHGLTSTNQLPSTASFMPPMSSIGTSFSSLSIITLRSTYAVSNDSFSLSSMGVVSTYDMQGTRVLFITSTLALNGSTISQMRSSRFALSPTPSSKLFVYTVSMSQWPITSSMGNLESETKLTTARPFSSAIATSKHTQSQPTVSIIRKSTDLTSFVASIGSSSRLSTSIRQSLSVSEVNEISSRLTFGPASSVMASVGNTLTTMDVVEKSSFLSSFVTSVIPGTRFSTSIRQSLSMSELKNISTRSTFRTVSSLMTSIGNILTTVDATERSTFSASSVIPSTRLSSFTRHSLSISELKDVSSRLIDSASALSTTSLTATGKRSVYVTLSASVFSTVHPTLLPTTKTSLSQSSKALSTAAINTLEFSIPSSFLRYSTARSLTLFTLGSTHVASLYNRSSTSFLSSPTDMFTSVMSSESATGVISSVSTAPVTRSPNAAPSVVNSIGSVTAYVGRLFTYKIPFDTFYDREDGWTSNLTLICRYLDGKPIQSSFWIRFDNVTQTMSGLPFLDDYNRQGYSGVQIQIIARDRFGSIARDVFNVFIENRAVDLQFSLTVRISRSYSEFLADSSLKVILFNRIINFYNTTTVGSYYASSISNGSVLFSWSDTIIAGATCNKSAISKSFRSLQLVSGSIKSEFAQSMLPEFPVLGITLSYLGVCYVPTNTPPVPVGPASGERTKEVFVRYVVPTIAVALVLALIAGTVIFLAKRRRMKPAFFEKSTFKKGKPVLLPEEYELDYFHGPAVTLPEDYILDETKADHELSAPHYLPPFDGDNDDDEEFLSNPKYELNRFTKPPPPYPQLTPRTNSRRSSYESPYLRPPPAYQLPMPYTDPDLMTSEV